MSDAPELLLAHHLKALRLPTFLREYDKQARICAAEGVDHVRYLARLTELELIDRERRMVWIKAIPSRQRTSRWRGWSRDLPDGNELMEARCADTVGHR